MYAADIAENSLVVQKTETEDDLNKVNEESQIEENVKTEGEENSDSNIQPDYGEISEYAGSKNEEETEKIRTEWQKIDGNWYYYNEDGTLRTGWLKLGKYYYYLDKKDEYPGRMVANQK